MARAQRRRTVKPGKPPAQVAQVNLNAAGIDVGATSHFVAVPPGRDPAGQDVREFGAVTEELERVAEWLQACGVTSVALEATGVYWIPLFEVREARGLAVQLVDPRGLRRPKKSDVLDCQWLQQMHGYGLLRAAFRPPEAICILRSYWRQRGRLIAGAAQELQHMQKALSEMNVHLHHVVSDLGGVTGMKIVRAILSGERDAHRQARLGAPKASTATARKLARIIYSMLRYGTAYVDRGATYYEEQYRQRTLHTLVQRAKDLGYTLVDIDPHTLTLQPVPATP